MRGRAAIDAQRYDELSQFQGAPQFRQFRSGSVKIARNDQEEAVEAVHGPDMFDVVGAGASSSRCPRCSRASQTRSAECRSAAA